MPSPAHDDYLKQAFGVDPSAIRAAQGQGPGTGQSRSTATPPGASPPPASPPAAAPPPPGSPPTPATTAPDPPPEPSPADANKLITVWPEQLVALSSALNAVHGQVQKALLQEQVIAAAGSKAKIDPQKTDAVAKAATRLGHALTQDERSRLKLGESAIEKSKLGIEGVIDRISEAKDHLSAFAELNLEEVHTPAEKEKTGHEIASLYDSLINFGKAVVDIVTGDVAHFAGWIVMQATLEISGGDVIKDRIEQLVDGLEEKEHQLEDGFNQAIAELDKFREKEIATWSKTLKNLRKELAHWLQALKTDWKDLGEDLSAIANAHKKDTGDLKPVMSVYQTISDSNGLLTEFALGVAQNAALADSKWPDLIAPIGSLDENTPIGYGLPAGWIGIAYQKGGRRRVFLVAGSGATFASSRGAAPAALEGLSASFGEVQNALAAQKRVAALAANWSKAMSAGLTGNAAAAH